jgi:hypothetical protein
MALNDRKPCSAETTSYCEARLRLPLKIIVRLFHATAEKIEDAGGFHRHKTPKIGDLSQDAVRRGQGGMALETFPGVPISATRFLT